MIAITGFCPFYHQEGHEKLLSARRCYTDLPSGRPARQSNPVESASNIAFANAIINPPKSPLRDQPGNFQEEGTANEREVEIREVG
jgi:hypothetical protein